MKTPILFKEYIWLVNTIHHAGRISLSDINRRWMKTEMSEGIPFSRATFSRHKDAIEDIFGIYIDCDRRNGYKYYIGNEEVLREDSVQNWMLSTLTVSNVISESLSLQKRILLEPVHSESDYLTKMIEAMKRNVRIRVKYRKYGDDEPRDLDFEPYCLKMFKQRWYVLGHFPHDNSDDYFGVFSFDRILDLELTDVTFTMDEDFDAEEFFSECFGIVVNDDSQPERIVIRAYDYAPYYIKDLPIHHSQREIGHDEGYTDFELFMRPTVDFTTYLLSLGTQIKVLSPEWLAKEVGQKHWKSAVMYDFEEEH